MAAITEAVILSEIAALILGRLEQESARNAEDRDDRKFKRLVERVIGRRSTAEWKFRDRF